MRKDQQPCFADTEPTQFKVALSDLNFALTRAVDAEPASIFTQTVFYFSVVSNQSDDGYIELFLYQKGNDT